MAIFIPLLLHFLHYALPATRNSVASIVLGVELYLGLTIALIADCQHAIDKWCHRVAIIGVVPRACHISHLVIALDSASQEAKGGRLIADGVAAKDALATLA